MDRFSRLPSLETILWIIASIAAFVALLVFVPSFLNPSSSTTAQRQTAPRPTSSPSPTSSPTITPLPISLAPIFQALPPFPTPAANAQMYAFSADPRRTGWISTGETNLHLGDRNLHAGTFKAQTFQSIVTFELTTLAPGSKITHAQVELIGLNRNNLAGNGNWTMQLLSSAAGNPNADLRAVPAIANVGAPISADQLGEGQPNQFVFSTEQLKNLEETLGTTGRIYLRLNGPSGADNLFTWDEGDRDPAVGAHPTLRLNAVATQFAVITNTPTPENVITAAADIFKITEVARRGTPTPLPRLIATATPQIVVTPPPTAANVETATAIAAYATAVAVTTGTFTPTPLNYITATPQPMFIPIANFTATPSPSPTLSKIQNTQKSIPPGLVGKIMFLAGPRNAPFAYIMDANGKNVAQLSDPSLYDAVAARDQYSPNGIIEAFNAPDPGVPDTLQIYLFDSSIPGVPTKPTYNQLTFLRRGIAFAPSWAPDSNRIAYTSTETGKDEIYVMDLTTRRATKLTNTTNWNWNHFPSWSPDGKQIVYASDQARPNTFTDIWMMNPDGTGAYRLLDLGRDAWGPVWIKWNK